MHDAELGEPAAGARPRVEQALAALALAALCIITLGNVLVRYFTSYSFAFTEEYSIFLMVVMTLVGSAAAVATNRHIRIGFLVDRLGPRGRAAAEMVAMAATALMFALLVWYGGRMAWDDYRFEVTSPGLGVEQWLYTVWLPILSVAVCARALARMVGAWRR